MLREECKGTNVSKITFNSSLMYMDETVELNQTNWANEEIY